MKRMLAFLAALLVTLSLLAGGLAASNSLQTVDAYSGGGVRYAYDAHKDSYRQKVYEALNGDGESYARTYAAYLAATSQFDDGGVYDTGDWVHLCLSAGINQFYDTFRLKSGSTVLTPYSAVIVSYRPGSKTFYVRYSKDLVPTDLGVRMPGSGTSGGSASATVQDPVSYSRNALRSTGSEAKNGYQQRYYKLQNGDAAAFCRAYYNALDASSLLRGLGAKDTGGWVHLCLEVESGANLDAFRLTSYGTALTPYSVVIVSYQPNSSTIYVRYSEGLGFEDLGDRIY